MRHIATVSPELFDDIESGKRNAIISKWDWRTLNMLRSRAQNKTLRITVTEKMRIRISKINEQLCLKLGINPLVLKYELITMYRVPPNFNGALFVYVFEKQIPNWRSIDEITREFQADAKRYGITIGHETPHPKKWKARWRAGLLDAISESGAPA